MRLVVASISHKTASLDLRERIALSPDGLGSFLRGLMSEESVAEVMLLSTCNRVELYVVPQHEEMHDHELATLFGIHRGVQWQLIEQHARFRQGFSAVHHLLRVTASLDSMVVGEPQILGQVKAAATAARHAGTLGPILDRLISHAFRIAKTVRTETDIAAHRVSVGSIAVELARRIFDDLSSCNVLLVGAGKMGETMARSLAEGGPRRVYVCNRSPERAFALAQRHGWRPRQFDELDELLAQADVVLTSTGSSAPIVTAQRMKRVIRARKYKPIFIVDIAVPRDVDPAVGNLDTVYLYNVDDLQQVASDNLRERKKGAQAAEDLVTRELGAVEAWFRQLRVSPTITAIRERAHSIGRAELERTVQKRLAHLSAEDRHALETMVKATVNKLLHPAMMALKNSAERGGGDAALVASAQSLFGVDATTPSSADGADPAPAPPDENEASWTPPPPTVSQNRE